jgi:hypothetical protein
MEQREMKMRNISIMAGAVAFLAAFSGVAHAQVLFSDNFEADTLGLEKTDLVNWNVTLGTVDVIGTGSLYDFYPGNGKNIDLSGNQLGGISTKTLLALNAGQNYTITFDLGKNGVDTESMNIGLGSFATSITHTGPISAYTPQTFNFVAGASGNFSLTFTSTSPVNDAQGFVLDNIVVTAGSLTAPEPGSLALLALGGAALIARRRKK